MSARVAAARVLVRVVDQGRSLADVLPPALHNVAPSSERGLTQELCYGVLRWHLQLEALALRLLKKPLKAKDHDIFFLMLVGLYQLIHLRVPAHTAVALTVDAVTAMGKPWAKALVNAVLRNFQRQPDLFDEIRRDESAAHAHPTWLLAELKASWPDAWEAIVAANNARAPMTLRVNSRRTTRGEYLAQLAQRGFSAHGPVEVPDAIVLERAVDVTELPGFAQGMVSVQDAGAQLAALWLGAGAGERVLDACAAPGGKACHVLERVPSLRELVAVEVDVARATQIHENLARLQLTATVRVADVAQPETWWDGVLFDRILLDAPCSATGVIRRHPDIKALRRDADIAALAETQARLLEALWSLLRHGGTLLYVTCSVLRSENVEQMQEFLALHTDAREIPIDDHVGHPQAVGSQILPGESEMDGFYYACIQKTGH